MSKIVTTERDTLVAIVCCMSTAGTFVPPAISFSCVQMNFALFVGALPGTKADGSRIGVHEF